MKKLEIRCPTCRKVIGWVTVHDDGDSRVTVARVEFGGRPGDKARLERLIQRRFDAWREGREPYAAPAAEFFACRSHGPWWVRYEDCHEAAKQNSSEVLPLRDIDQVT